MTEIHVQTLSRDLAEQSQVTCTQLALEAQLRDMRQEFAKKHSSLFTQLKHLKTSVLKKALLIRQGRQLHADMCLGVSQTVIDLIMPKTAPAIKPNEEEETVRTLQAAVQTMRDSARTLYAEQKAAEKEAEELSVEMVQLKAQHLSRLKELTEAKLAGRRPVEIFIEDTDQQ
jgi:hypothetical protein